MPVCVVSFSDTELIRHRIEVEADSLFEAAAVALVEFRSSGVVGDMPGAVRLQVEVRRPPTFHELPVSKVEAWLQSSSKSPNEQAMEVKLRESWKRLGR